MRIAILGAGPAGLYLGTLLRRSFLRPEVDIFEQNSPDATFGFGVVFSDSALEFLRDEDPATYAAVTPSLETWADIHIIHRGERIVIDGVGFTAIGRLKFLQLLRQQARMAGVILRYDHPIRQLEEVGPADLIVGADGVNSLVRRSDESAFGTRITSLTNRFAWFGTPKRFEALTQTFVEGRMGAFNAHHYPYSAEMSTFIVECDEETFNANRLGDLSEQELKGRMEQVFAETLAGAPLVSNNAIWRRFPVVGNQRWSIGDKVLLGDALHTAHFSIGSGTRLAMEDAIALSRALEDCVGDVASALPLYQQRRQPILDRLVSAANASAAWYEAFATHMALPPADFALSYLMRTGRMSLDRIERQSPGFMRWYNASRRSQEG